MKASNTDGSRVEYISIRRNEIINSPFFVMLRRERGNLRIKNGEKACERIKKSDNLPSAFIFFLVQNLTRYIFSEP
jgi:hypothetical protein